MGAGPCAVAPGRLLHCGGRDVGAGGQDDAAVNGKARWRPCCGKLQDDDGAAGARASRRSAPQAGHMGALHKVVCTHEWSSGDEGQWAAAKKARRAGTSGAPGRARKRCARPRAPGARGDSKSLGGRIARRGLLGPQWHGTQEGKTGAKRTGASCRHAGQGRKGAGRAPPQEWVSTTAREQGLNALAVRVELVTCVVGPCSDGCGIGMHVQHLQAARLRRVQPNGQWRGRAGRSIAKGGADTEP